MSKLTSSASHEDAIVQALEEQRRLAKCVRLEPKRTLPEIACGVDVSYLKQDAAAVAVAVLINTKTFTVLDCGVASATPKFPYIPGLLSFRELPLVIRAIDQLERTPELIIADGHGYAHPERFGLASHIGVATNIPTIGCAKAAFVGNHELLGPRRGDYATITDSTSKNIEETIGYVLRTRTKIKPVYVSAGHLIDHESSREIVLALCQQFRLPETTRQADQISRQILAKQRFD